MYIREEYLGQNLGVLFTAVEYRTKGKNCGMEAERWKYFKKQGGTNCAKCF